MDGVHLESNYWLRPREQRVRPLLCGEACSAIDMESLTFGVHLAPFEGKEGLAAAHAYNSKLIGDQDVIVSKTGLLRGPTLCQIEECN